MNDTASSLGFREVKCSPQGHTACDDMSPWLLCQPVLSPLCSSVSPGGKQLHRETHHLVCLGAVWKFDQVQGLAPKNVYRLFTHGSWGSQMPREDLASEGYQKASSQVRAVEQRLGGARRQGPSSLPATLLLCTPS